MDIKIFATGRNIGSHYLIHTERSVLVSHAKIKKRLLPGTKDLGKELEIHMYNVVAIQWNFLAYKH